jgi:RimJ/RimL family protein N-acetyltransferase
MENNENYMSKIVKEFTSNGISGILNRIWNKTRHFLFYSTCSIWFERNLDEPVLSFTPELKLETEFLIHDKSRLIEWLRDNKSKYPWIYFENEVDAALKNEHVFLILLHQDRIIGYIKIGIGDIYINDFNQYVKFQPKIAFVYDTFTLPEYRGKSLALFALNQAIEYFNSLKYMRIFCHIETWNVPSIKAFEKAGFRAMDSIRFIRTAYFSFFIRGGRIPFRSLERYMMSHSTNEQA